MDPTPTTPPTSPPTVFPCAVCGYDLVGQQIGAVCPECGASISPIGNTTGSSSKAVGSLVLGILSVISCMWYGVPAVVMGPIAIVLASKAKADVQAGKAPPSSLSMAAAGKICGIIGLVIGLVFVALIAFFILSNQMGRF